MAKKGEYKSTQERDWRSQQLPQHPLITDMQTIIEAHIEAQLKEVLVEFPITLSTVVEFSINYVYRQWIELREDYDDNTHDAGIALYVMTVIANPIKDSVHIVHLKAETVEKITAIGDYLSVTKLNLPYLRGRWKGVYNRKQLILLAMNFVKSSLDKDAQS